MRSIAWVVLLWVAAGFAAAASFESSMPDIAKTYYQRSNCHQAYDVLVGTVKRGEPLSPDGKAWVADYEQASEKGGHCPAPPAELAAAAADHIVETEEGLGHLPGYMKAGDAVAMFEAGMAVLSDKVPNVEKSQGLAMIKQSSDLGYAPAQFLIASGYIAGSFGEKDYKSALPLLEAAAAQGHVDAQFMVANFYKDGIANRKDSKKALDFYRQAAEQGHTYAAIMAFYMVQDGEGGVSKDMKLAYRLARNLADQGWAIGDVLAASALLQQKNAKDNEDEVLYWMDLAARDGDDAIRQKVGELRPRVVAAFDRAKAPPEYVPPRRKQCPMKTTCLVDISSGLQECHTNKDYWNDCDF